MPTDPPSAATLRIPLSRWADNQLAAWARVSAAHQLADVRGQTLLGERAMLNRWSNGGRRSAGGGCHLFATSDGLIALNLSRQDDRDCLPALLGRDDIATDDHEALAAAVAQMAMAPLVKQGRLLSLAIAAVNEQPAHPPVTITATGRARHSYRARPLVVDLSSLWAGPLASHLLNLSGAQVVKVESRNRPDSMRHGDPALFALLQQGKDNIAIDLHQHADCKALIDLIQKADAVIEASRPRALLQLGIDADAIVAATPGLVWLTITGHGGTGEAANWIGFGDDTAVAGGLSAALEQASGKIGFVGDAVGDPLAGIVAARTIAERLTQGVAVRAVLSMSGIVATALAEERANDEPALTSDLQRWASALGQPFPAVPRRASTIARPLGADNGRWLS